MSGAEPPLAQVTGGALGEDVDEVDDTPEISTETYLRTEFMERLAHELRGPTGVTMGALDELELALGPDVERFRTLLTMARRGARKVLRTADRLSRTAQVEGGRLEVAPVSADLAALIRRTATDAEAVEGRRTVKLALHVPDVPCLALLDPTWAQVCLFEVITNAIRGARRQVEVTLTREGSSSVVRVSDDGMAEAMVNGNRFGTQADRRDTGLAMPLALDIARAHGGDLRVETASNGRPVYALFFAGG